MLTIIVLAKRDRRHHHCHYGRRRRCHYANHHHWHDIAHRADPRLPWSQICVCAFESCLLRADGCIAQAVAAVGKTPIFWTDLLDARIRVFDVGLAQD